jgi:membrane-associated protease RseP (regulator of RpoE activity)
VSDTRPPEGGNHQSLDGALPKEGVRERRRSQGLFLLTLLSVFWVYGTQWEGGDPFRDGAVAWESAKFAMGLMGILLAHEMGHYFVARRHGFALSLPYFIPFPAAFGTFGAIIRLKSLPRSRTALLEMGAAGPLAGFVVAIIVLAMGLSGTVETEIPRMVVEWSPELPPPPPLEVGWLDTALGWIMPVPEPGEIPLMILANPPIMDLLGWMINGQAPGRYAELDPLAMAGWVGCMLTAINLLPIGQLDGGHCFNAIWPEKARQISKIGLGIALLAGFIWAGWAFWGILLLGLGAWRSLPVPTLPALSSRAIKVAAWTLLSFFFCFMPTPVELETLTLEEVELVTPEGEPIDPAALRAWMAGEDPKPD